jgi:hypothetical protein
MAMELTCPSCASEIRPSPGYRKRKIRCGECGHYRELSDEDLASLAEEEAKPAKDDQPVFGDGALRYESSEKTADTSARDSDEPAFGVAEDDLGEENSNPYSLPPESRKPCSECRRELPIDAQMCTFCGTDLRSGVKAKRRFQPIEREWEVGYPFQVRLAVFLACLLLDAVLLMIASSQRQLGFGDFFGAAIFAGLQAFLLGSYERLRVTRDTRGRTKISITWRYLFIPRPAQEVAWRGTVGCRVDIVNEPGFFAWATLAFLFICGIIPAILFWYYVIQSDSYEVYLTSVHGVREDRLFRTLKRERADEVRDVVCDAAVLRRES